MFRIGLLALALTTTLCTSSAQGGNNYRNNHRHQGTYGRAIHWNGGGIYWGNGQNHYYQRPSWNHYPRYRW